MRLTFVSCDGYPPRRPGLHGPSVSTGRRPNLRSPCRGATSPRRPPTPANHGRLTRPGSPGNEATNPGRSPETPTITGRHPTSTSRAHTRTSSHHTPGLDDTRPFMDDTGRLLCRPRGCDGSTAAGGARRPEAEVSSLAFAPGDPAQAS